MNHIEFIPLIEFATKKDEASKIVPIGTSLNNSMEWDLYQQEELKKNYLNPPQPISSGIYHQTQCSTPPTTVKSSFRERHLFLTKNTKPHQVLVSID